ncbi:MAG: DUF3048 domain-containing protein [Clostridiales bacterium]|nr:DUF3048 domain-containing protein [Candidatus Equinaster intestinalis]
MTKKLFCIGLCAVLTLCICGCSGAEEEKPAESVPVLPSSSAVSSSEPENPNAVNYLTGLRNLDKSLVSHRPVALMVDNDSNAQKYTQTGVNKADIVYETETEGGITRLMTVFADISNLKQIGDVRSARYVYVDLALAHDAVYIHSGKDKTYCGPHLNDIDNFEIGTDLYGQRIKYGQAFGWQTLFTSGKTLLGGFADKKWRTETKKNTNWQSFADEKENLTLASPANKITAAFNSSYISYFTYDSASGSYKKTSNKAQNKDRADGTPYLFKNVLILKTPMSMYPDNYRRKIDLNGGSGYYAVNGTYQKIKWKKGGSSAPITLTNEDGTPLKYNAGNTWVCIIKDSAKITME